MLFFHIILHPTVLILPWVPEAFHAQFPDSVKSYKVTCVKSVKTRAQSL